LILYDNCVKSVIWQCVLLVWRHEDKATDRASWLFFCLERSTYPGLQTSFVDVMLTPCQTNLVLGSKLSHTDGAFILTFAALLISV
jgi:hypothetical protein